MPRVISRLSVSRYRIPLQGTKPFANQHHYREGLLISIWDSDGFCAQGEVAPLAGFSHMDLNACQSWLIKHLSCWLAKVIPSRWDWSEHPAFYQWHVSPVPDSCKMGLEAAWLELVRQQPLFIDSKPIIPRCALISDLATWLMPDTHNRGEAFFHNGLSLALEADPIKAVKVKVGHEPWQTTRSQLVVLRTLMPSEIALCLDGNQKMLIEDAVSLVDSLQVAYFEEPLINNRQHADFFLHSGIPYAWDETLQVASQRSTNWFSTLAEQQNWQEKGLSTVVLKPTLLGGLWQTWRLAQLAAHTGKSVILSSAFESSLGISQLEWFATQLPGLLWAGLDTLQLMKAKLQRTPRMWSCVQPQLNLPVAIQEEIWAQ
ncbi:enolase C-terminal domain-like protein [Zooshikella sp. RANM57]|uniref:enolase C-terminal domain-like protein n=1 Tax=Zooshikella sp. RANM57 TaxID=3425863 RepID=UPI003D6DDEA6